jgi:glucose-1-phosphate thymidylyltransferase
MVGKAVILARGLGTRMRRESRGVELGADGAAMADRGLKALMPIAGRPFLHYVADSLIRAGARELCFVIAPEADLMREHARRIAESAGVQVACVVQDEPRGTADAVLAAEEFVAGGDFLLSNGDNLYPDDALAALADLPAGICGLAAFDAESMAAGGNIDAERIRDFAVVVSDAQDRLERIVEKPANPEDYTCMGRVWVSMNLFRFSALIFDACRRVEVSPRGELELPDAVARLAESDDVEFRVLRSTGPVLDLSSRADVPGAAAVLADSCLCFPKEPVH